MRAASTILLVPALLCAQTKPDAAAVRKAIDAGNAAYLQTLIDADPKGHARLFTEQGAQLQRGGQIIQGRAALEAEVREGAAQVKFRDGRITTTDVFLMEEGAYETGSYSFTIQKKDGSTRVATGHYLVLWKQGADGAWLIHRDVGFPDPR